MDMKDISEKRKKELGELAALRAQFIPELFAGQALAVLRGLTERISVEKIENPTKQIMLVCDELPRGEAMLCLMLAVADNWMRMREGFEAYKKEKF